MTVNHNPHTTVENNAGLKQNSPLIRSYRDEVINSASFDLEWIPIKGKYQHNKTKIYAASFCTNWGERIVLHISRHSDKISPERALLQEILFYLDQFPLTFGWYSTGVCVYNEKGDRVRGRNSDLFILHQRCLLYSLKSPIELRKTYAQETIDTINEQLKENQIPRHVSKYWICQKREGAFPKLLDQVLSDRNKFLQLLKEEKSKSNSNPFLIEDYQTHQLGAKLFANAGFGLFGNEYFKYSNYQVAECITAEGRRIHKKLEKKGQSEPYNFEVIYGFTDSTFFKDATDDLIQRFIKDCKDNLGITVDLKNVFINSIFYGKKNRYVAWTGVEKDEPIIKGLDGQAESNPLWMRRWFKDILVEIIKHPGTRFEIIPKMMKEAFYESKEICNNRLRIENELKFTHRLKKYVYEYAEHVRTGIIARLLEKDKGDIIHWYETVKEVKITKNGKQKIVKGYSITPDNLNIEYYKKALTTKLRDTLEITEIRQLEKGRVPKLMNDSIPNQSSISH